MLEQPVIGGEGHDRAENDEVAEREPGTRETETRENPRYSRVSVPTNSNCKEPASSESADRRRGCPERCERREYMTPTAQENAPSSTASEPRNTPGPDARALLPIKRPTPPKPKTIPARRGPFKRHCLEAMADSRKTQSGSLATRRDASPEGTLCSAQCNVPWPMRKKKVPMMMLA